MSDPTLRVMNMIVSMYLLRLCAHVCVYGGVDMWGWSLLMCDPLRHSINISSHLNATHTHTYIHTYIHTLYDAAQCDNDARTAGGSLEAEEAATTVRRISPAETLSTLSRDSLHSRPAHHGGRAAKNGGSSEFLSIPPSLPLV